ncbi:MDR family MFS transporter [Pseudorhodobacter sp.]|uniref:MDR family MFS transporter n=1 Tax=Pseudorhodobacter sp. TaxID=1934400 RepID=UPI00264723C3|nr:MDR family MFS transporter [Pseudorhodobacter sp.]MDN5785574.1 MFS transporter [Pseudorhodobacter sp.]
MTTPQTTPAKTVAGEAETPGTSAPAPAQSTRLVIASVAVLLLLASLDQTIVSTALPTIVADLGGLEHLSWVVTAYILASTIAAPLYGKLGDLYGRRNMVFVSVGIFLLGSSLCGLSQTMGFLIASRALQGLGGGGLFVLALSVIGDVVPPRERGKIQGVFAGVFSLSSVLGPLLGGWFVDAFSWHWIFYINLPLGALAVAGFGIGFAPTGKRAKHQIDWAGAAALTLILGSLTLVTSLGGRSFGWGTPQALGLIALCLASLLAFVVIERRAAEPILPPSLFTQNVFVVTSIIGFITGASMFGAITFLPLYLQIAKEVSPTVSGLMLIPMTAGILLSSTGWGQCMGRTGRYRMLPIFGMVMICAGAVLLTRIDRDTGVWMFSLSILVLGLGLGSIFPVVTTAVQNAVPRAQLGTATAAGVMFRQVGGSLAVAVFGAMFAGGMASALDPATASQIGGEIGPRIMATLPAAAQQAVANAIITALHPIYWVVAGMAVFGFVVAQFLKEVPLTNRMVPKGE